LTGNSQHVGEFKKIEVEEILQVHHMGVLFRQFAVVQLQLFCKRAACSTLLAIVERNLPYLVFASVEGKMGRNVRCY